MGFELSSAVGVAPGVVEGDPRCQSSGAWSGTSFARVSKPAADSGDSTVPKIRDRAIEDGLGTLRRCLSTDWKGELDHHEELEDEMLHFGRV